MPTCSGKFNTINHMKSIAGDGIRFSDWMKKALSMNHGHSEFEHEVNKVKDKKIKEILKKNIKKIIEDPEIGKPLRYALKGDRTIRIAPFRLIYAINGDSIILLRFEHRSEVYD